MEAPENIWLSPNEYRSNEPSCFWSESQRTDYDIMKLSKERLAELLVERDSKPVIPISIGTYCPPCYEGGPCTNPFHDCINCHRQFGDGEGYTITTSTKE